MKTGVIALSEKQLNRWLIINKTIDGTMTVAEAASALGLSSRQIQRLKKDVIINGPAALIHKNSLRKPQHAIDDATIQTIVSLKQSPIYEKANFKHFQELLEVHHDIHISYTALRNLLLANGIISPKKRRRFKPHRRRKRKAQVGMLIQVDATSFRWFQQDNSTYTLHGAIDDASGQIVALYLCKNECLLGYFEMLRRCIDNYGIPVSIYADRHTIFRSPKADKVTLEEQLDGVQVNDTQFSRALKELGIELIAARSPQAKGRIERLWGTLQSRLSVELALRGITDLDSANAFLEQYIYSFNSEFAVEPEETESAFRKLSPGRELDYILCVKDKRKLDNGQVFSYHGKSFKVVACAYSDKLPPKAAIEVLSSPRIGVKLQYEGLVYQTVRFAKPARSKTAAAKQAGQAEQEPRQANRPFECKSGQWYNTGAESDREIREMLDEIFTKKFA